MAKTVTTLDGSELVHGVIKSIQDEGLPLKASKKELAKKDWFFFGSWFGCFITWAVQEIMK